MANDIKNLLVRRNLGPMLVVGILLVIGIDQIALLVGQFSLNSLNAVISLRDYFGYVTLVIGSIGITALFWIEIKNLEEFHIDKFALITFILGSLLRPRIGIIGEECLSGLLILSGILMAIVWMMKKPIIPKTNRRWTILGIMLSGFSAFLIAIVGLYLRPDNWFPSHLLQNSIFPTVLGLISRQFSDGVAFEEILFRGFLWGYLKRLDVSENKIIWIQGLAFWFLHFGRIFTLPFTFFLGIPLIALVTSKLTSYSKQTYPSILSHTIINTVGGLLNLGTF